MESRIVFGETGVNDLLQWLRSSGEPQDIQRVLEQYLRILRAMVVEEEDA
jgi:hypothetical protein